MMGLHETLCLIEQEMNGKMGWLKVIFCSDVLFSLGKYRSILSAFGVIR